MKNEICGVVLVMVLCAAACSGDKDATDAVESAADAAEDAAGTVTEAAKGVVEEAKNDPMKRCLELAAEKKWKEALEPCTEAVKANPDDLAIKHAFQQAQAAAQE